MAVERREEDRIEETACVKDFLMAQALGHSRAERIIICVHHARL
jgi:hypothetical protein